jgi:hypothetical protein
VHKAELVGILLGLHILSTKKKNRKPASIDVDNQAVIKAFDLELRNPGHHLAQEALRMAKCLKKKRRKSISKKEPACTYTYYALLCLTGTHKAFVRNFSVRPVSQVKVLQ